MEIFARGAYTAPIRPETREHATERVGTQRDDNPMGTRVSAIAGDRAGSLRMGFRGLAVKGSGVRIPSAPRERETLEPQLWLGFRRVWGWLAGSAFDRHFKEIPSLLRSEDEEKRDRDHAEKCESSEPGYCSPLTLMAVVAGAVRRQVHHAIGSGSRENPHLGQIVRE